MTTTGVLSVRARTNQRARWAAVRRASSWWQPALGILGVAAVAELLPRLGLVNPDYLPPISAIIAALLVLLAEPAFWQDLILTLSGWAQGLGLAVLIGAVVGIAAGLSDAVFHAIRPIVEFMRPVPSVALIPLAILAFGAGMESKVFLATFAASWPVLIHSMYGVRDLDPVQIEVAKSYRVTRPDLVFRVILPNALPYIATGIRIASSIALALVVSAELIIGVPGIGQAMSVARASGAVEQMYALLVISGLLGWGLNALLRVVESRALAWHQSHREAAQ